METIAPARSGRPRALLPVLLAAPFLAQVDATVANVATPAIRTSLGASGAAAELVVGGYLATHVSDDGGRRTGTAKRRRSCDLMTAASQGSKS